jgi:methyl-accepting chemotaxis protein
MKLRHKLSTRLIISIFLLLLITLVSIAVPSYFAIVNESDKVLTTQMSERVMCAWDVANGLDNTSENQVEAKKAFEQYIISRKVGEKGYGYVVDSKGISLYHPNRTQAGLNLFDQMQFKEMVANVSKFNMQEFGMAQVLRVNYVHNGDPMFAYYTYYKPWDMIVVLSGYTAEFQGAKNLALRITVFVGVIILILASILTFLLAKSITNPIVEISEAMTEVKNGNLILEKLNVKGKDEVSMLRQSFNEMLFNVSGMIKGIQANTAQLKGQSTTLFDVSKELSKASDEVSGAISQVANGATDQASDLVDISGLTQDFGSELDKISLLIDKVHDNSRTIDGKAQESNSQLQALVNSIKHIRESFKGVSDRISKLGTSITNIQEITSAINSIADQTNLLALNAAIEAARAGEAGRGFSVVADEIRKLAEQSKVSSQSINKIVGEVTTEANEVTQTTNSVNIELKEQTSVIESSISSFEDIVYSVKEILPQIEQINEATKLIDKKKVEIVARVETASSVAEETSATSEEISASAQEMNSSAEEVSNSAKLLSVVAGKISSQLNRFKI